MTHDAVGHGPGHGDEGPGPGQACATEWRSTRRSGRSHGVLSQTMQRPGPPPGPPLPGPQAASGLRVVCQLESPGESLTAAAFKTQTRKWRYGHSSAPSCHFKSTVTSRDSDGASIPWGGVPAWVHGTLTVQALFSGHCWSPSTRRLLKGAKWRSSEARPRTTPSHVGGGVLVAARL